jgi:hypothetical protein
MGWTIRVRGFDSQRGMWTFVITASTTALGPTQPPIQWVPGALSLRVKRPGREADHTTQSGAEVKEWVELYLQLLSTPSWPGAQLKHRDNFTFYNKNSHRRNDLFSARKGLNESTCWKDWEFHAYKQREGGGNRLCSKTRQPLCLSTCLRSR